MIRDEWMRVLIELAHDPIILGVTGVIVLVWALMILVE